MLGHESIVYFIISRAHVFWLPPCPVYLFILVFCGVFFRGLLCLGVGRGGVVLFDIDFWLGIGYA